MSLHSRFSPCASIADLPRWKIGQPNIAPEPAGIVKAHVPEHAWQRIGAVRISYRDHTCSGVFQKTLTRPLSWVMLLVFRRVPESLTRSHHGRF